MASKVFFAKLNEKIIYSGVAHENRFCNQTLAGLMQYVSANCNGALDVREPAANLHFVPIRNFAPMLLFQFGMRTRSIRIDATHP